VTVVVLKNFKELNEANLQGWTVVDVKKDWKKIYPP